MREQSSHVVGSINDTRSDKDVAEKAGAERAVASISSDRKELPDYFPRQFFSEIRSYRFFDAVSTLISAYFHQIIDSAEAAATDENRSADSSTKILKLNNAQADLIAAQNATDLKKLKGILPGSFVPPAQELIRFTANTSLAFQPSEIDSLTTVSEDQRTVELKVSVLSLLGSQGVLPHHYTEIALKSRRDKNLAFESFVNLLQHRATSLLYKSLSYFNFDLQQQLLILEDRALFQKRFALANSTARTSLESLQLESSQSLIKRNPTRASSLLDQSDTLTRIRPLLFSTVGLSQLSHRNRLEIDDSTMAFYSGLLGLKHRPANALRQVLADYFQVQVTVDEFCGKWSTLLDEVKTSLGSVVKRKGINASLGHTAILGEKAYTVQSRIAVKLGPVDAQTFERFRPGSSAVAELESLLHYFCGNEISCDVEILIDEHARPDSVCLGKAFSIGWNAWLYKGIEHDPSANATEPLGELTSASTGANINPDSGTAAAGKTSDGTCENNSPYQSALRIKIPIKTLH